VNSNDGNEVNDGNVGNDNITPHMHMSIVYICRYRYLNICDEIFPKLINWTYIYTCMYVHEITNLQGQNIYKSTICISV
jgi:hypothetical protein